MKGHVDLTKVHLSLGIGMVLVVLLFILHSYRSKLFVVYECV